MDVGSTTPVEVIKFKCIDLPVSSVTVFPSQAEIKKSLKAELKQGMNEILIEVVLLLLC